MGKNPILTFEVQDTTRNIVKVGALRDGLLISLEKASKIISHSGEIVLISIIDQIHDTCQNQEDEHSIESPVQ